MSKQDIWMPLYIADYLADTTRLNTEQHGAYMLMIMDYWRNGPLPDNDDTLANITRLSLSAWKKHKPVLRQLFTIADGQWQHKRINEELETAKSNAEKYANRAKKAAEKRWSSNTSSNATSIPEAKHEDMLADATSPSPSSTVITTISENITVPSVTPAAAACIAIREVYDLYHKAPTDISPSNPTLAALIEAGATVDEFRDSAMVAMNYNPPKGFAWILGKLKGQRQDAASMGNFHKGAMPTSAKEAGIQTAAKSIFKPTNIQHLTGAKEIEVHDAVKSITA